MVLSTSPGYGHKTQITFSHIPKGLGCYHNENLVKVAEEERGGVVLQARCSRHAGGMVVCGKGGKKCLVTTDRFSWTSSECWRHQSDWRLFNNYIYFLYWSNDKALLIC